MKSCAPRRRGVAPWTTLLHGHRREQAPVAGCGVADSRYSVRPIEPQVGGSPASESSSYHALTVLAARALRALSHSQGVPGPDLVHDVAVRALLGLSGWRAAAALPTWVYSIARNEVARRARSPWYLMGTQFATDLDFVRDAVECPPDDPEERLARQERCCAVARGLAALPLRRRICLLGLSVWELSAHELSQIVGGAPGSVRVAAAKARKVLRCELRGVGVSDRNSARDPRGWPVSGCRAACSAPEDGWLRCPAVVPQEMLRLVQSRLGSGGSG